jgi:hypothetical protein
LGCQRLNLEPVWGLRYGHRSGVTATTKVPSRYWQAGSKAVGGAGSSGTSAAGEGPFQRHQLPGAPVAGVDQDRRLADVEALDGRVEEVVTHVGDYPGDDLVASAGLPEAGGVPGGGQPRCPSRRDCAACSAWSRHTITVKNDGFPVPPTGDGGAEHGPGDPAVGVADLRVVGEVAGEADAGLGHGPAPSCCLAGQSALLLDPGDAVACHQATRNKRRSQPGVRLLTLV